MTELVPDNDCVVDGAERMFVPEITKPLPIVESVVQREEGGAG